jgi:hypothetical protein
MKHQSIKQTVMVGVLGILITAAVMGLVITYAGYLPTITSVPLHKSDAPLAEDFYRIARNGFIIAGVCGVILGFSLPVIFRFFSQIYGKRTA